MGDLTVFTQNGTQSAVTKWTENTDRGDIWIQVPGIDLKLDPQTKVHPLYIYMYKYEQNLFRVSEFPLL